MIERQEEGMDFRMWLEKGDFLMKKAKTLAKPQKPLFNL